MLEHCQRTETSCTASYLLCHVLSQTYLFVSATARKQDPSLNFSFTKNLKKIRTK